MSRPAGAINRVHYHVARDGHLELTRFQGWQVAWDSVTKRARQDSLATWRVSACPPSGCRVLAIR